MLILDRGYSLAKLPRFFEGVEKFGEHPFRTFEFCRFLPACHRSPGPNFCTPQPLLSHQQFLILV